MTADAPLTADELAAIRERITALGLNIGTWVWEVTGPELEDISTDQLRAVSVRPYADLTVTAPSGEVALRLEHARAIEFSTSLLAFLTDVPDLVPRLAAEVERLRDALHRIHACGVYPEAAIAAETLRGD